MAPKIPTSDKTGQTAGLSPAEALRPATLAPARCFERDHELGTVAPGKLADLLVLNANPLGDIRHSTRIETVVINGRVYERAELNAILARREAAVKAGLQ